MSGIGKASQKGLEIDIAPSAAAKWILVVEGEEFAVVETHHERTRIVYPSDDGLLIVGNFYREPHDNPWHATQAALRDRSVTVCGTEGRHTTLWSCVVDLSARRLAYAKGSPLEVDYEELPWGAKV